MAALGEMVPSVDLLRALIDFNDNALAGADIDSLTAAIVGWEHLMSFATASQMELLAEADRAISTPGFEMSYGDAVQWYPNHLGLLLDLSAGTVCHRLGRATHLVRDMPNVHAALKTGVLTRSHAETAARCTRSLDEDLAQMVDAEVMVRDDWRTPSQLEKSLARTILDLDPGGAAARHQAARKTRDVRARNEPDGMMSLFATLPAENGQALVKKIEAEARSSKARNTPGDTRTLAERRADVLVDLVLRDDADEGVDDCDQVGGNSDVSNTAHDTDVAGADHQTTARSPDSSVGATEKRRGKRTAVKAQGGPRLHGRRPEIYVMVAQSTLMGADDAPSYLEGYGWIDATSARRIAADPSCVWRRLIVDPVSGRLLDFGRDTYRPPQDMTDHVIARDLYCTFPTCDLPAVLSDLDHLDDWGRGGHTSAERNGPACRRHHRLKEAGWVHDRDRDTGDSIWIDPSGTRHTKRAARLPTPRPVEPPDEPRLDEPPPF